MNTRELEIAVAPDGSVELHVKGFPGKSCLEIAKLLEEIVGEQKSQEFTDEYYQPEADVQVESSQHRESPGH